MDLLGILRIKDSNGNWVSVPGLKGDTGEPFKILGIYATAAALEAAVTDPEVGDVYLVGTTGAYDIYLYLADGWHNTGRYMPKGDQGDPAPQSAITSAVETWLAANVDPETGYVLDRSLSQENAAAPADLVGDLIELSNNGYEIINTVYAHGNMNTTTGEVTVSENNYKYQAVTPNLIKFDRDITIKAASGYVFQAYWYESNGTYIGRSSNFVSEYLMASSKYFRLFIRLDPHDTTADVDTSIFAKNIYVTNVIDCRLDALENTAVLTNINLSMANNGTEQIETEFAHGRILTTTGHVGEVSVSENNYKYQAVTPDAVSYTSPRIVRANSGYVFQPWWYDDNDTYISRSADFVSEYTLIANCRYRFFIRLSPNDTTANVDVNVFKQNVFLVNAVGERVEDIENKPLSTLPTYILNNMAEKPLGSLSKGYILLSFDDGAVSLATGTIPLLIENEVPGTFGLLPESAIFASGNESELATVVDAVENHGCVVAMHGSAQWPTYTESALYKYFNDTIALFDASGLGDTYGAICPGGNDDDTSALVKAVAGGKFGYVFSGNRADKISYDTANADGKYNGARSNRFDLDRRSGIGITTTKVQAIVNYAVENHLLLCPFWHDNTLNDENHPEYITYFNALISAAKDAGLTFITTKDLPNIT